MTDGRGATVESGVELSLNAGGDPVRNDRLLRELHQELAGARDVDSAGIEIHRAPGGRAADAGAKGSADVLAALLVLGPIYAQPAAEVLCTAIRSWSERNPRAIVRARRGDSELEITGSPSRRTQDLLREFLGLGQDDET